MIVWKRQLQLEKQLTVADQKPRQHIAICITGVSVFMNCVGRTVLENNAGILKRIPRIRFGENGSESGRNERNLSHETESKIRILDGGAVDKILDLRESKSV